MALKLASLNIEGNKHFDKFLPFFKTEHPDVVCMQEVFSQDLPMLKQELEMKIAFAPMTIRPYTLEDPTSLAIMGVAICTHLPLGSIEPVYYYGNSDMLPLFRYRDETRQHRPLLLVTTEKDGEAIVIATTHFMVTEQGVTTDYQRRDLNSLLKILNRLPEVVLCGDFNAPRGGEIFDTLAKQYTDNIPPEYTSSIDGTIHRAGLLPYMIDGLFTTSHYKAEKVKLNSGLSDHLGITALISRA